MNKIALFFGALLLIAAVVPGGALLHAAPARLASVVPPPDHKVWDVGTPIGQGRDRNGAITDTLLVVLKDIPVPHYSSLSKHLAVNPGDLTCPPILVQF